MASRKKGITTPYKRIVATQILNAAAIAYEIDPRDITSGSQQSTIVAARRVAMYWIRTVVSPSSLSWMSGFFKRHHSTIIFQLARLQHLIHTGSHAEQIERVGKSYLEMPGDFLLTFHKVLTPSYRVVQTVAGLCGLQPHEIMARGHRPSIVRARRIAMHLMRTELKRSNSDIALFFGRDCHKVMSDCRKVQAAIQVDISIKKIVASAHSLLNTGTRGGSGERLQA
jgi:chromosomal replication initiation ATPase DnaA